MKKICSILLILMFICTFTSACTQKKKENMVKSERRFEKYMTPQASSDTATSIDLSEGPKTNYNANFGPKNLNFDIKIVDPY